MGNSIPKLWLSEISGRGVNAAALVITVRSIGVEAYGIVGYVSSIVVCLIAVVQFGSDFIAVRELASVGKYSLDQKAELRVSVLSFRLVLALGACTVLVILGCGAREPLLRALLFASTAGIVGMILPLDAILQVELEFGKIAAARILMSVFNITGIFFFVNSPPSAWCIPLISGVSLIATQAFFISRMRIDLKLPSAETLLARFRFFAREGLPLCASILLSLLLGQAAIMLLRWFRSPQELGWYTASFKVFDIGNALLVPAATVLYPHIAALRPSADLPERTRLINNGVRVASSLSLGLLGIVTLGAHSLLPFVFGAQFQWSSVFLVILSFALFFRSISMFFANALIAVGKQRTNFLIAVIVTLVNLTIGYATIPSFGPLAAAITTVCSFAVEFILLLEAIRLDISFSLIATSIRKILFIGCSAFAVSWLVTAAAAKLLENDVAPAVIGVVLFTLLFARGLFYFGTLSLKYFRNSLAST